MLVGEHMGTTRVTYFPLLPPPKKGILPKTRRWYGGPRRKSRFTEAQVIGGVPTSSSWTTERAPQRGLIVKTPIGRAAG